MKSLGIIGFALAGLLAAQEPNPTQQTERHPNSGPAPLYRVDVVARTTKAVSYLHRSSPTKIGLAGTVLLPGAEAEASIKNPRGAAAIEAKFKNLPSPHRFGHQYLTYVLWAITPEGRAANLGEIVTNSGDKAKLATATDLQTFALIVTAEPYYAVSQPSDVVVLENVIRPDTTGRIHTVDVRYELLPRGRYSYDVAQARQADAEPREKLSQKRYEALVELYQARNAVQLARAQGAAELAPEVLRKAEKQLKNAEDHYRGGSDPRTVVTAAREATQTAEDSRLVALRRQKEAEANDNSLSRSFPSTQ